MCCDSGFLPSRRTNRGTRTRSQLAGRAGKAGAIHLAKRDANGDAHMRLARRLAELLGRIGCHYMSIPRWSALKERIPLAGIAHNCGTVHFACR